MKLENYNNYTVISGFDSPVQLYSERSTWENCLPVAVFRTDFLSECTVNGEIQSFFRDLPFFTVLAVEDIQKYPLDFLMLFDMRISDKPYVLSGDENISYDTASCYGRLCGEHEYYRLKSFLESDRKAPFETALAVLISGESSFDDNVKEYIEKVLNERTLLQVKAIVSCLTAMRNGGTEKSLTEESRYFYKLIKDKSEELNGKYGD